MKYKRKTLLLILIATVVRFVIAYFTELGNDEVYYRMYAQYLQWNYFDHPPIVGWLIRLTTFNLHLDNACFIRLGAIGAAAVTTWMMYLCGKRLNNEFTGFLAALIYTSSLYGSIIAGTFILPDSPQMVCWAVGIYLLLGIVNGHQINNSKKRDLLIFGLVAGIGMLCKIHTVFLWLALLMYILLYNRQWLKQPVLYISPFISLLLFYPVLKWNIDNHFVTYLYHSERVVVTHSSIDFSSFLTFFSGQIFYYNPIIFFLIVASTVGTFKNKFSILPAQKNILLFSSIPLICIAIGISFFKNVLPHWTGPAYSGLILLTAYALSKATLKKIVSTIRTPKILVAAIIFQMVVIVSGIFLINFMPGTFGNKEKNNLGEGDFTLDMYGWRNLKTAFKKIVTAEEESGLIKKDAVIVCNKWFPASHIDYYVALPLHKDLIAIGDTSAIHQYVWINNERKKLKPGDDAYCIVPSNNFVDVNSQYGHYFEFIQLSTIIEQQRNGKPCRYFFIWRMKNYKATTWKY
ncbi:MAG: ArnT family glycosyltransferase [Ferruginibacter sp.]